ncbi:hypothetical protein F8O01_10605 [Pseudoclavibacter chungangensis]|uniref:DUF6504 domain-containing protein n=1 Tax=Pseudoclavibacter chungangensis TaxID=587635 RepID=A0A7J5BSZ9_9MICO|nr:DUF6504 family protein [Pseudoclavibacter chungangensis]KAB1656312.1 hypothetical protein F8O01_10605 [Pseudoclavibacter chungangensis]NYJ67077.1 hypothetical protein [Pseudoclavibacter chungangensis]
MEVGEAVDVELSPDGAPIRFEWRRIMYGVISTPEPWLGRSEWWRQVPRAPRDADGPGFELELWRVDAVPLAAGGPRIDGTFDLLRAADGTWTVTRAWSDELDARLFA